LVRISSLALTEVVFAKSGGGAYVAAISTSPFSEGGLRSAYKVEYVVGWRSTDLVVKCYKPTLTHFNTIDSVESDMKIYARASELSASFNTMIRTLGSSSGFIFKPVRFVGVTTGKITLIRSTHRCSYELDIPVLLEQFISGAFEKYNSNFGYVHPDSSDVNMITPQCLSHFSWAFSKGTELVCDLQGCRHSDRYDLTDPAICSIDERYGVTDIGVHGFLRFFQSHKCNSLCNALHLDRLRPSVNGIDLKDLAISPNTTMGFLVKEHLSSGDITRMKSYYRNILDGMESEFRSFSTSFTEASRRWEEMKASGEYNADTVNGTLGHPSTPYELDTCTIS
jgi:hypothetical protein